MPTQTRTANKDAMMGKQIVGGTFSGWNGQDNHLPVGTSAGGSYKFRSLVAFNVDFSIMKSITSATLTLYGNRTGTQLHCFQDAASGPTVRVSRVTRDWAEGSADPGEGNITGTLAYEWDNMNDKFTTDGQYATTVDQNPSSNGDAYTFDVTDIVTSWFNGSNNFGFMIRNANEDSADSNKGVQFYSRSIGTTSWRPKLEIVYTSNTPPYSPELTSPVLGAVTSDLVPTLSGVSDDADDGDYMTAVAIEVQYPAYRFLYSNNTTSGDPGSGYFRLNSASLSSATEMYISETDLDGNTLYYALNGISTSSGISIGSPTSNTYQIDASISSITDLGAYRTLSLSTKSGTVPPAFGYEMYAGGGAYFSSVSQNIYWSSGEIILDGGPPTFSVAYGSSGSATSLTPGKYYRWKARTRDSASDWGIFSRYSYFKTNTAPNPPSISVVEAPADNLSTLTPSFVITHSDNDPLDTNMYAYELDIQVASTGVSVAGYPDNQDVSLSPSATKTVSVSGLSWGTQYRVRARTTDQWGTTGINSDWIYVTTRKTAVPTGLSPTANGTTSTLPIFVGQRGQTSDVITSIDIELQTDETTPSNVWASTGITSGVSSSSFSVTSGATLVSSTNYRWRVRVTGSTGGVSDWSAYQYFSTYDATVPSITSPSGSSNTILPTITVTRATNFIKLNYEIYPASSTDATLGTATYSSGDITFSSTGTRTETYGGSPALSYNTEYKIRARVYDSDWSSWTGLSSFRTLASGSPTLYSVGNVLISSGTTWITDSTPTFTIDGAGADVIKKMRAIVYNSEGTSQVWDSTLTPVAEDVNGRASITMSSAELTPGTTYQWTAMYETLSGSDYIPGDFKEPKSTFRLNKAPNIPSDISPETGFVFADTLYPTISASFSDDDRTVMSDSPSGWYIVFQGFNSGAWSDVYTKSILHPSTTLANGLNSTIVSSGYTFENGIDYRFRTYYSDSKLENGEASAPRIFSFGLSPTASLSFPFDGTIDSKGTVTTALPSISWAYSGGTQYSYKIDIDETSVDGTVISGTRVTINSEPSVTSTTHNVTSTGIFRNNKYYKVTLTVTNTLLLPDPSPSIGYIVVNTGAPAAIQDIALNISNGYSVQIDWTRSTEAKFQKYKVMRKLPQDTSWNVIAEIPNQDKNYYNDYFSGNGITYDYAVTVVSNTTSSDGTYLESAIQDGESKITGGLTNSDIWWFVGRDRAPQNIIDLPVVEESHRQVIQQESFETLGSDRKLIIRGFVLGNEGSITCVWKNEDVPMPGNPNTYMNETIIARRFLEYISRNKGPHLLKSPFGDVWEVTFEGPEYRWSGGGILEASMNWIETADEGVNSL